MSASSVGRSLRVKARTILQQRPAHALRATRSVRCSLLLAGLPAHSICPQSLGGRCDDGPRSASAGAGGHAAEQGQARLVEFLGRLHIGERRGQFAQVFERDAVSAGRGWPRPGSSACPAASSRHGAGTRAWIAPGLLQVGDVGRVQARPVEVQERVQALAAVGVASVRRGAAGCARSRTHFGRRRRSWFLPSRCRLLWRGRLRVNSMRSLSSSRATRWLTYSLHWGRGPCPLGCRRGTPGSRRETARASARSPAAGVPRTASARWPPPATG